MLPETPDSRERSTAAAMHIGSIFAPFLAPALIWAFGRRSPFVASHARKAFFEALFLKIGLLLVGLVSLTFTARTLIGHYETEWRDFSVWPFLLRFALGFVLFSVLEAVNTMISLREAHRAYRGEWPKRFPHALRPNSKVIERP